MVQPGRGEDSSISARAQMAKAQPREPLELGDRFIERESIQPTFAWKSVRAIYAWPESSALSTSGSEPHAVVGPGGTLIVEPI